MDKRLKGITKKQRRAERRRVKEWMNRPRIPVPGSGISVPRPLAELIGIPPHRIQAYMDDIQKSQ